VWEGTDSSQGGWQERHPAGAVALALDAKGAPRWKRGRGLGMWMTMYPDPQIQPSTSRFLPRLLALVATLLVATVLTTAEPSFAEEDLRAIGSQVRVLSCWPRLCGRVCLRLR
jgi:hypothetical protein